MSVDPITASRLRELLSNDAETGKFLWLESRGTARSGNVAGSPNGSGYIHIRVAGRTYKAHRLAYLYAYGRWPDAEIDHINGVRDDNRLANLREASHAENMQNIRRAYTDNKSCGLLGASWHKRTGSWQAKISAAGKLRFLGHFDTADAAHAAYLKAKSELHPFNTISKDRP
jgi:hypothetical protein